MLVLETPRLILRTLTPQDLPLLLDFDRRNREWLAPWEPLRDEDYLGEARVLSSIRADARSVRRGTGVRFHLFARGQSGRILGSASLSNMVTGVFLSAHLGYRLDGQETGQGLMGEAVGCVVDYAFEDLGLHRIEANVMPRNTASRHLLKRLGFEEEGLARRYLKIAGAWEDHIHHVRFNRNLE